MTMNREFRAFVARSQFSLSLGKTHIDLLMQMDAEANQGRYPDFLVDFPGMTGLLKRGLIVQAVLGRELVWKLTVAGELVCALLDEAMYYPSNKNYPTTVDRLTRIARNDEYANEVDLDRLDMATGSSKDLPDEATAIRYELGDDDLPAMDEEEIALRERLDAINEMRRRVAHERDPLVKQARTRARKISNASASNA